MIHAKLRGLMPCAHLPFIRLTWPPPSTAARRSRSPGHRAPGPVATPCSSAYMAVAASLRCGRRRAAVHRRRRRHEGRRDEAGQRQARARGRRRPRARGRGTACATSPTPTGMPCGDERVERPSEREVVRSDLPNPKPGSIQTSSTPPSSAARPFDEEARTIATSRTSVVPSRSQPCTAIQPASGVGGDRPQRRRHVVHDGRPGGERPPPRRWIGGVDRDTRVRAQRATAITSRLSRGQVVAHVEDVGTRRRPARGHGQRRRREESKRPA